MLYESVQGLNVVPDGVYVDATFGGGGHAAEILRFLSPLGRLYAFDQDADAERNSLNDSRFTLICGNFAYIDNYLRYYGVTSVDGLIADLGVSSYQFDTPERGFSFRLGLKLDMRMNVAQKTTVADILNTASEPDLLHIFKTYCDIQNPTALTHCITAFRAANTFDTIAQFVEVIAPVTPKNREYKYLAQVFQALRIAVNDELNALSRFLTVGCQMLKPGGRLVVIAYHSLEDKMVKNIIKTGNVEGKISSDIFGNRHLPLKAINRNVIVATADEVKENSRAKSAKLRIAEKI